MFDRYADRYDEWYMKNVETAENEICILQKLIDYSYDACVEIGGGTGFFSQRFNCLNIDPSISMLQRSRLREVESIQGCLFS